MKDVSIIIVNHNTADLIPGCIESVLRQDNVNDELIVVDNASTDDSESVLLEYEDHITLLLLNKNNLGLGKASNQAFRASEGRYLYLLSPGVMLLSNNDLRNMVCYMDAHPEYGLVGTRMINSHRKQIVTMYDHYPRQKQTTADFSHLPGKWSTVLGASMIIRRDVFEKMGGFDEDFFLYAEETDLCLRIRKQGYKIGYYDGVTAQQIGASVRKSSPEQLIRRKKRAKYLFYRKHYPINDVMQMAKKDRKHAKWHWLRLAIKKKIVCLSAADEWKMLRHRVTCEVTREILQSI